ncbi:FadR/GntR family transcriptional regulator [Devosia alba]|uniref:FadR/GntR family transcriptional regulator n=1 Tax=Devosia alba TaxID=3152360 RepID=UPI003263C698
MTNSSKIENLDSPIQRLSVPEQVAGRILDLVRSGTLKPGDQLPPERDLAVSLQVSRPSVREAIRGLTILGVVTTRQGGGAYISALGAEELLGPLEFFISLEELNVRQLYDARLVIESDVARRAAAEITDEQLARLTQILEAQALRLDDPISFRLSDTEFHEVIWRSAANPFLYRIGKSLNVLGMEFRRLASETPGILAQSHRDHRVILAALSARDADAAATAAASHMRNVFESTLASLPKKDEQK